MEDGALRRFVNVFVAGEDVRFARASTRRRGGPGGHHPARRRRGLTARPGRRARHGRDAGSWARRSSPVCAATGVRVLATARTLSAERAVTEAGAEPLYTDAENLGEWAARPPTPRSCSTWACRASTRPVRRVGARRRARPAAAGAAAACAGLAGERPVVMLSTGLLYGAAGRRPRSTTTPAHGRAPRRWPPPRRGGALAGSAPRIVRVPWVYGPGGLARDLIVGLRTRRFRDRRARATTRGRCCRPTTPRPRWWRPLDAPPGVYSAAEADVPDPVRGGRRGLRRPGHPRPDHVPPGLAGIVHGRGDERRPSRLSAVHPHRPRSPTSGGHPADDWRRDLVRLAEGSLPLPGR